MSNLNAGIGTNANVLENMANWLGRRAMFWFSRPAEERVARFANFMDSKFKLPWLRLRFGWDPILNIIPIVGPAAGLAAGLYLLFEGRNLRLGRFQQVRMVTNLLVDSIGGSLPMVGWVFDWLWKANSRNAAIILRAARSDSCPAFLLDRASWRREDGRLLLSVDYWRADER